MTIWEHCSHMTLSERPILYNYAPGGLFVMKHMSEEAVTILKTKGLQLCITWKYIMEKKIIWPKRGPEQRVGVSNFAKHFSFFNFS